MATTSSPASTPAATRSGRDNNGGALIVQNWWWEDGVEPTKRMTAELQRCFRRFLRYLDAPALQVDPQLADRPDLQWLAELAAGIG